MPSPEPARLGVWMVNVRAGGGADMMQAPRMPAATRTAAKSVERPATPPSARPSLSHLAGRSGGHRRRAAADSRSGYDAWHSSRRNPGLNWRRRSSRRRSASFARTLRPAHRPPARPASATRCEDRNRTASASGALTAGASYIVVGRSIVAAPDPRAAAARIAARVAVSASTITSTI